jgi:hypothetical protein
VLRIRLSGERVVLAGQAVTVMSAYLTPAVEEAGQAFQDSQES